MRGIGRSYLARRSPHQNGLQIGHQMVDLEVGLGEERGGTGGRRRRKGYGEVGLGWAWFGPSVLAFATRAER